MMTPSAVIQETGRINTRQQIQAADAYRASKGAETSRRGRVRAPWAAIASAIRARGETTVTVPRTQSQAVTAI